MGWLGEGAQRPLVLVNERKRWVRAVHGRPRAAKTHYSAMIVINNCGLYDAPPD
jgi:hypothetical protein